MFYAERIRRDCWRSGLPSVQMTGVRSAAMTSASLRSDQVERIATVVRRMRAYLDALSGRIDQKHFPRHDPLKVAADRAAESVRALEEADAQIERDLSAGS